MGDSLADMATESPSSIIDSSSYVLFSKITLEENGLPESKGVVVRDPL